ncbi:MAG: hypothetical protein MHM6MM_007759 [Cercozoa sp. M6MM]
MNRFDMVPEQELAADSSEARPQDTGSEVDNGYVIVVPSDVVKKSNFVAIWRLIWPILRRMLLEAWSPSENVSVTHGRKHGHCCRCCRRRRCGLARCIAWIMW